MKRVKIFVEGGGDRAIDHVRCREGFRKLIEKAGFADAQRMPSIVAGGPRDETYKLFKMSFRASRHGEYPILLVDSEDPLDGNSASNWAHLKKRDNWDRPPQTAEDQAQLMVTCMETWIMADHEALSSFFGRELHSKSLLSENDLEARDRHSVQEAL